MFAFDNLAFFLDIYYQHVKLKQNGLLWLLLSDVPPAQLIYDALIYKPISPYEIWLTPKSASDWTSISIGRSYHSFHGSMADATTALKLRQFLLLWYGCYWYGHMDADTQKEIIVFARRTYYSWIQTALHSWSAVEKNNFTRLSTTTRRSGGLLFALSCFFFSISFSTNSRIFPMHLFPSISAYWWSSHNKRALFSINWHMPLSLN